MKEKADTPKIQPPTDYRAQAVENIQRLRPRPKDQAKETQEPSPYVLPDWPPVGAHISLTLDVGGDKAMIAQGLFEGFFFFGEHLFIKILSEDLSSAYPVERILELVVDKEIKEEVSDGKD